jgi:four helix bundle protein
VITCYRDLDVWQRAMEVVECCYRLSEGFPRAEEFGLRGQMRRAAVSVPSNIAEGHGRTTTGEYLQQLSIARGSLMELETHVLIAGRLGYIPQNDVTRVLELTSEVSRMLASLAVRLREKAAREGGRHP